MSEFFLCEIENIEKSGVEIKVTGARFKKDDDDDCIRTVRTVCFDFTKHDKVFEDKIARLEKENKALNSYFVQREQDSTDMIMKLKQHITELESKEMEKVTKINLNDRIKVKLTPLGAEIYYNRYDFLKSSIRAIGGVCTEPKMPKIDEDGYTEMTMWQFIELYGKDIDKINREVIKPLDIIIV